MSRFLVFGAGATRSISFCAFLVAFSLSPLPSAPAAITSTGDVAPSNPSTWTASTIGYIGNTASGTLTVDGGSGLLSNTAYIGYYPGSTGSVTVSGTNSNWTNSQDINVGYYGSGSLNIDGATVNSGLVVGYYGSFGIAIVNITNGGRFHSYQDGVIIGNASGSNGAITVDGPNSTCTSISPTSTSATLAAVCSASLMAVLLR